MKKILIVEDDKNFMMMLKNSLANQPVSVFYAEDGEIGLEKAEKENPDLILIDIMMPKLNGIEMAKKIKEKGLNPKMIFLTNLNDEKNISEVLENFDQTDYILKSDVNIDAVIERVKNKLGIK